MPSIIPSYIYTIFASLIVSSLVIGMCGLEISDIKMRAEKQQLSNIADYVAAKTLELATSIVSNNVTCTLNLDVPNLVDNEVYWIRIANYSSKTWVEIGFGNVNFTGGEESEIPLEASASGVFISGLKPAFLHGYVYDQIIHLELS
jgi:hypothetical protein